MTKVFSTVIKNKKWREISAYCGFEKDLNRSYKVEVRDKASIILYNDGLRSFEAEWGLIPEWSTGATRGTLIHARYENLTTSPSFRIPIRQKRCLIPVDSFYIRHKTSRKDVPYRVSLRNEEPMYIAGLWDKWETRYGIMLTFAIITNKVDDYRESLGNRVPMVFEDIDKGIDWLKNEDYRKAISLLENPVFENLNIYRITDKFDLLNSAEIHKEIPEELTLFD